MPIDPFLTYANKVLLANHELLTAIGQQRWANMPSQGIGPTTPRTAAGGRGMTRVRSRSRSRARGGQFVRGNVPVQGGAPTRARR
jgi:hypothetical protein